MYFFDFANVVIETVIAFFYFSNIFNLKDKKSPLKFLAPFLLIVISTATGMLHLKTYMNMTIAFCLYCMLVYAIFDGNPWHKFFSVMIYMVILYFADTIAILLFTYFGISYSMVGSDNVTFIVGAMLSDFARLWLAAYVGKILSHKVQSLPGFYWLFMVLCPVLSIICLLIFDFYLMQATEVNVFLVFFPALCILGINFMLFYFFEAFSSKIRLKVMEELAVQERENYKVLQQNEDELRALRHDIKNHTMMLKEYLDNNDTQTALNHLQDLEKSFTSISSIVYTSNPAMDAALNIGSRKAQAEGVLYKVQIIGTGEILIDSADICTFFGNAIDNAIEGSADCIEKYVYIEIHILEDSVKIHIENSTQLQKQGSFAFFTTKKDKKNHGYGMKNMKVIVNKYQGEMIENIKDGIFYLDVTLQGQRAK